MKIKKLCIACSLVLLNVAFNAFNVFSKTADFDWNHTKKEVVVTKTEKGFLGSSKTVKTQQTIILNKGVSSLSIGALVGYPEAAAVVRYRAADNRFRFTGTLGLDYSPSLVTSKVSSTSFDFNVYAEYAFKFFIGGKKDKNKLWNMDIATTLGLGLYFPLDNPKSPRDYNALLLNMGLTASVDLPYSSLPLTCFARVMYRSCLPFVSGRNLAAVSRFGIDLGAVYHVKIYAGGIKYQNNNKSNSSNTKNNKVSKTEQKTDSSKHSTSTKTASDSKSKTNSKDAKDNKSSSKTKQDNKNKKKKTSIFTKKKGK